MDYDDETRVFSFLSGLALGAVIGAGITLLTAPNSGRRTRRRIRRAAVGLRDSATDRWEDLAQDVKGKVDEAIRGARSKFAS
jgi:gas vesicle protein